MARTGPSAWARGCSDTAAAINSVWFWFFDTVLGLVVATAALLILLKWGPKNVWVVAGIPPAVGLSWLLTGILFLLVWHLFWAPYRQRNEAQTREAAREAEARTREDADAREARVRVRVNAGHPFLFRSEGRRFIMVPALHISNPLDPRMELDISIRIQPLKGASLVLPATTRPIADATLFSSDRFAQLLPPLPLEPQHQVEGYVLFEVHDESDYWGVRLGEGFSEVIGWLGGYHLLIEDGISGQQVADYELGFIIINQFWMLEEEEVPKKVWHRLRQQLRKVLSHGGASVA